MLSDNERAALERLRKNSHNNRIARGLDRATAIAIALRDHLPDDQEPVTRTWAKTLVDENILGGTYRGDRWIPIVRYGDQSARLSENATRGDFRALCRVLGIETKE